MPLAGLALAALVLIAHMLVSQMPDREELGPRTVPIRFDPLALDRAAFVPLRLVGAWALAGDDRRIGGVSGLAIDGGELVALTDSGAVIRFAKPSAREAHVHIRELPAGPGDPSFKMNRDSEALARDPLGRGWWVAFENKNALWLYDRDFAGALGRIQLPRAGLGWNRGIEGLAIHDGSIVAVPEGGGRALELRGSRWRQLRLRSGETPVSEAAVLSPNSLLLVERRMTVRGFANALVRLDRCGRDYCLAWRKLLPLGPLDNVEALAVEPLSSGGARLWLMTDDNFRRPLRTILIAADLPPRL